MRKPSTLGCEAISSLAMIERAWLHTRAQRRALSVQRQLESLESEWSNCLDASTNHSRQTARRPGLLYRESRGFAPLIGLLSETWLEPSVWEC